MSGDDLRDLMRSYRQDAPESRPARPSRRWFLPIVLAALLALIAITSTVVVWYRARSDSASDNPGSSPLSLETHRLGSLVGYAYDWSPDGNWVAYFGPSEADSNPVLWRITPEGKRQRRVPADMSLPYRIGGDASRARIGLSWGPHGAQLACGPALPLSGRVWTVDLESRLTWDLGLSYAAAPDWSPDGGELAFVQREFDSANRRVSLALRLISADGTEEREIGRTYCWPPRPVRQGPVWSADGGRIIVPWDRAPKTGAAPPRQGPVTDAWIVDRDGSKPHPLATSWDCQFAKDGGRRIHCEYTRQCWSPRGDHVVVSAFDETDNWRSLGLFRVSLLTARAEPLAPDSVLSGCLSEKAKPRYPTWSPDGDRIAFIADDRLYLLSIDEPRCQPVATPQRVLASPPLWSPDGKRLLYASPGASKGIAQLYAVAVAD